MYFDYAATTPIREEVLDVTTQSLRDDFGNPSSQYAVGRMAKGKLEAARRTLGEIFDLPAADFTFTSGASESNATILLSNAGRLRNAGKGNHIITSIGEHPSVFETCKRLEEEGFQVDYLPLLSNGEINLDALEATITEKTVLLSLMAVNNETGAVLDLERVEHILGSRPIFWHADMVQAMGKLDIFPLPKRLDAFTATAHKVYGPKGVGFFYQRGENRLRSLISGGHQEHDRRAGTENLPGILGMTEAFRLMKSELAGALAKAEELDRLFYEALNEKDVKYEINGFGKRIPSLHNLYFPGTLASKLLIRMDLEDVAISAGSACSAGALEPSRVLTAMFGESARVKESVRISFGKYTTNEEVRALAGILAKHVNR